MPDLAAVMLRPPRSSRPPALLRAGPAVTGVYGKLPGRGDFIRRGLPPGFAPAWHDWLAAGLEAARSALGPDEVEAAWDRLGPWCFVLAASPAAGLSAAGVLAGARDSVGRAFPLTLVLAGSPSRIEAPEAWFEGAARLAEAGRAGALDADELDARLAALPTTEDSVAKAAGGRWWRGPLRMQGGEGPGCPLAALLRAEAVGAAEAAP